jgi:carbamoylphosphate synthase small subunit
MAGAYRRTLTEAKASVVFTTASCGYPQSIRTVYTGQVLVFAFPSWAITEWTKTGWKAEDGG